MPNIRKKFFDKNFSTESVNIILGNWGPEALTYHCLIYNTYIKKWQAFCDEKQINPVSSSP